MRMFTTVPGLSQPWELPVSDLKNLKDITLQVRTQKEKDFMEGICLIDNVPVTVTVGEHHLNTWMESAGVMFLTVEFDQ